MGATMLTDRDYERLSALVGAVRSGSRPERAAVLGDRLRGAAVLDDAAFDTGCVKMGCVVQLLDLGTGKGFTYRLTFPADANIAEGRISVLSPLGAALLGRTTGEEFSYESPGGTVRMRTIKVIHEERIR
jgi:regulator of nucleoside diphosphate kinase